VYGILDAGLGNESKTVTNSAANVAPNAETKYDQTALAFSTMTSSRLGFLATEEMDGGTKATVKVETGISSNPMAGFSQTGANTAGNGNPATPVGANGTTIDTTSLGNRELNVSLAFTEGTTVKAGYGSTPVRDISLGYAPDLGGNLVGNLLNNDATLGSNRSTSLDVMQQFGPVKAIVSVSQDKLTNTNAAGVTSTANAITTVAGPSVGGDTKGTLIGAEFKQDAMAISVAYQSLKSTPTNPAGVASADTEQKTTIVGASYDLKVVKILAEMAQIKNTDGVTATAAGTGTRTYTSVGVQAPVGPATIFGQISMGKVNRVTTNGVASESRNATGMTVGAKYNMSKQTYAYVSIGNTKLNAGSVDANAAGVKVSQLALGLVKAF
jgi:predicted porin